MDSDTPPRRRTVTLSDIDDIVDREVKAERRVRELTYEWLNGRLTSLEGKVIVWGVVPTIVTSIAAIAGYFLLKR